MVELPGLASPSLLRLSAHGPEVDPSPTAVAASGHGWIIQNNSFLAGGRSGVGGGGGGPSHSKPLFFSVTSLSSWGKEPLASLQAFLNLWKAVRG